ncbi:uncharacterized protein LOC109829942 [Asparagus officinalis]|nr:uncharacterized protein LOC109829942 [Asparagus officinalis]
MDQETLSRTLVELLSSRNFHFVSPVLDFFGKLKGGEFEPGVSVYRRGLSAFKKREHYYRVRKYHNSMVSGLLRIKGSWEKCEGYGVEERLRVLNIMRSRSSFGDEDGGDLELEMDSGDDHFYSKRIKRETENPESRFIANAEGFGKSTNQKLGIVGHEKRQTDCVFSASMVVSSKAEKKQQLLKRCDKFDDEDYTGLSGLTGKQKHSNGVTIASYAHDPQYNLKKSKHSREDWMSPKKVQAQYHMRMGAQVDWSDANRPTQYPLKFDGTNVNGKKWKMQEEFGSYKSRHGRNSATRPYKFSPAYNSGAHQYLDNMPNILKKKSFRSKVDDTESMDMEYSRGNTMFDQLEETESDSSDQDVEGEDANPWVKKLECLNGGMGRRHSKADRSVYDPMKVNKLAKHGEKLYNVALESRTGIHAPEVESYVRHGKQKPFLREKRQESAINPVRSQLKTRYRDDYSNVQVEGFHDASNVTSNLHNGHMRAVNSRNQTQMVDGWTAKAESYMPLLGCKSVAKKRTGKVEVDMYQDEPYASLYQDFNTNKNVNDLSIKKKKKIDSATGSKTGLSTDVTSELDISGKEILEIELEMQPQPQKKPFTLITPTIHTGFSFSIIHLLSAIRKAMISSSVDDVTDGRSHIWKDDVKREVHNNTVESTPHSHKNTNETTAEHEGKNCLPSLTVQEIANRVRSNPGDPCILETQEPLQDLIRGVLKIFSSKTAPLGAKGWKALVSYEKSNKGWSWVGPVSSSPSDSDNTEEETSPEAWGIPYKILVNLVNSFANWLKSSQETLQQIGNLPAPPVSSLVNLDEKERFRDLKTQKNPHTINPSSDEQKAYFRKEEYLRYSIPDRAFSYTAADGKKSSVAPMRRGAGKPTSKARDHYILKPGRPPHVTILCLVRDAAARLPGSIGTRADVCTLIRDSQYIVEDVNDAQVNQVVSGALDRLHYEVDPCIHFDGDRKLWVYLHRDREEEDFDDDGTSSTKNWKRPRKDATEHPDMDAANDPGNENPSDICLSAGFDLNSDVNIDSSQPPSI